MITNRYQNTALIALKSISLKILFMLLMIYGISGAVDRFPRPEFQNGYTLPQTTVPAARAEILYYVDVAVLFAALCCAAWLALKKRSRKGLLLMTIFSVLYFGFYRKGCICSIGSIQNVTAALFNHSFALPLTVILFFTLPLLFTLFFGRVFCSSVCPLGALQELFILKPVRLPAAVEAPLKIIPHLFLGAAVLFAATGSGFIICRLDPFVGVFRLSAPSGMMLLTIGILVIALFVARPYCRFLCPYGVLLQWMSSLSKWNVKITNKTCINCRLCESACPVNAIRFPTNEPVHEKRAQSVHRIVIYTVFLPLFILAGATGGWFGGDYFSTKHPRVKLAEQIVKEENGSAVPTIESETFRTSSSAVAELISEAATTRNTIRFGSLLFGAYAALIIGLMLLRLSTQKKTTEYIADHGECISCGRCFRYCPENGNEFVPSSTTPTNTAPPNTAPPKSPAGGL
jgi:ferredoxin